MAYEITNTYTTLKLSITTNVTAYSHLKLRTYINDSSTVYKTYTPTLITSETIQTPSFIGGENTYMLYYDIATKDYTVGDFITKFELVMDSTVNLWQTHEGVTWIIDGVEVDTTSTNTKKFNWTESDTHTIEAVYVGNDGLQMSSTGKYPIIVEQPPDDDTGSLANDGAYKIKILNKGKNTFVYGENSRVTVELRKGGVPVVTTPPRNVEVITPKSELSPELDNNGRASVSTKSWDAGKYTISAFYQDERAGRQHIVTRDKLNITVEKGTPTLTDNYSDQGSFIPSSKYKLVLKFNNEPLVNQKITLYINGTVKTLTTDKKGAVYHAFPKVQTYKIKAVYKGNKNLKKVEKNRTVTVVKPNG